MLLETQTKSYLVGRGHEYVKLVLHRSNYKLPNNIILLNIQNTSFNNVNKFTLTKLEAEAGHQDRVFGTVEWDSRFEGDICSIWNELELTSASGGKLINGKGC